MLALKALALAPNQSTSGRVTNSGMSLVEVRTCAIISLALLLKHTLFPAEEHASNACYKGLGLHGHVKS